LRDFVPIDLLKNLSPEDIEDITERFVPLFQDSQESDTVKRINLPGNPPLFVVVIVEHESEVNYSSSFKMLQYITLVLDNYEKEANKLQSGISSKKDFRYPPVLPIVFYDGKDTWTAEKNFKNRTALSEVFGKYIPGFEYELVDLSRYSRENIIRFGDVLSYVMLLDQIGTLDGKGFLEKLPQDYSDQIGLKIPDSLRKLLGDVIRVLLARFGAPEEETEKLLEYIDKKEVGTMFDVLVE
jgi:hypothetical protein